MKHLQTEIPILPFDDWLVELVRTTARETRRPEIEIVAIVNKEAAKSWWEDGFSPYCTFRECYQCL